MNGLEIAPPIRGAMRALLQLAAAGALTFVVACGSAVEHEPAVAPSTSPSTSPRVSTDVRPSAATVPAPGASMASRAELRIAVSGPSTANYVPGAAGPAGPHVRVRVTNTGARPADVATARVSFTAEREGVAFPCKHHVGGGVKDPEPTWLEPGQSFTFERDIDCALSALGRYEIGVLLSFGHDDFVHGEKVGALSLDVAGAGPSAPRPYPGRPELHVALTGAGEAHTLTPEQWRRGDYHLLAVLVNTGRAPITLGDLTLALDVVGKGRVATCPRLFGHVPANATLAPGETRAFPVALRCPLKSGDAYDVTAYLALGAGPPTVEVGRVHLRVKPEEEAPLSVDRPPGTIQIGEQP